MQLQVVMAVLPVDWWGVQIVHESQNKNLVGSLDEIAKKDGSRDLVESISIHVYLFYCVYILTTIWAFMLYRIYFWVTLLRQLKEKLPQVQSNQFWTVPEDCP